MEQVISDSEISSCQEVEEMRQQAERAAIEKVEMRINEITRIATEAEEEIVGETNVLQLELQNEMQSMNMYTNAMAAHHEDARQQLQDMLDLQSQLTDVNIDTVNLLSTLQELREQNYASLRSDPVYTLVLEERYLRQQLDELGIYVCPPTGSDEHYQ